MPFDIFLAITWFHLHKMFILCCETTDPDVFVLYIWSKGFCYSEQCGEARRNNNQKVLDLESIVGVAVHPVQTLKAFDELPNLYAVFQYPNGILHLFYWSTPATSV